MKERPKTLMELYKEICQGRSFSEQDGKISSIHLPSIRYFAHFISRCVLAKKVSSKLSANDLAFIAAALGRGTTHSLGGLIAFRLAANRSRGGFCGGLITSRLLAFHGLEPHYSDFAFAIKRLNVAAMINHSFVSPGSNINYLPYIITLYKKSIIRTSKSIRTVELPAPLLFNLNGRGSLSITEEEIVSYIMDHSRQKEEDDEEDRGDSGQHPDVAGFTHQSAGYDFGPSASSSAPQPDYGHASQDSARWSSFYGWD